MAISLSLTKDRADFQCAAYKAAMRTIKIVEDVYEGSPRIRDCRQEYLPKNPMEGDDEYQSRVTRSVFSPVFKRALGKLVGLVFRRDPNWKEVSDGFINDWKNIDLAGTKGEVFARNVLQSAAKDGHAFIYVEMPPPLEESDTLAPAPTLKDEHDADLRPYWILYKKGQAINWRTENINGKTVLTLIVFREMTMEGEGDFGEKQVTRFRVLRPGSWKLYRKNGRQLDLEREGKSGLDYIPIFPVYGEECAPLISEPPLLELAIMAIQLYQKQSDLDNILHFANVPVMWARDRNTQVPIEAIGPSALIDLTGEHSMIGFAEHQGHAIEAAMKDIETIKVDMAMAALSMLAEKTPGPKTATGEIIDSAESNSEISLMVKSLQGATQNAYEAHEKMAGRAGTGSFEPNVEYDRLVLSVDEMRALGLFVTDKQLSLETMLELLKRAGKLGVDFDVKTELERIFGKNLATEPDIVRDVALDNERHVVLPADAGTDPTVNNNPADNVPA